MKSQNETVRIIGFLNKLSESAIESGIHLYFSYDNFNETVKVTGDIEMVVNVHMDSISAVFRDVIQAITQHLEL